MKKSLVALAILAAAGVASAQSSVTLFGVVDAAIAHGSGSGVGSSSRTQLVQGANTLSRLGFRGTEDLGGGMAASFWLEAGVNNDNGSGQNTNTNNQTTGVTGGGGLTFNRRSTVSLSSGLGELRLGRDFTPQFWNRTLFDPFSNVGAGGSLAVFGSAGPTNPGVIAGTGIRASNSIGYFLPGKLGGFYGQIQHYLGENNQTGAATEDDGKGTGIRLGFANGPVNVAIATSSTSFATTATTGDIKTTDLGASYNFGVAQVMALVTRDKVETTSGIRGKGALVGALVPMGAGQIRAAYSTYKTNAAGTPGSKKIALGYVHNLSKRTALYATLARVTNSGGAARALNGAVTAPNNRSTGYDFGVRHSF